MYVKTIDFATSWNFVGGLFAVSQGNLVGKALKRQRTRCNQPSFKILARRSPSAQERKQTRKASRRELTGSLVQSPNHGLGGADGAWTTSRSRRGSVSEAEAAELELRFEAAANTPSSRRELSLLGGAALCAFWLMQPAPAEASTAAAAAAAAGSGVDAGFWTKYWFMLPTATCVATCCLLSGIGGAALFSPIFLLVFPLLGPQYPLGSPAAAFTTALLTECFGFSSGLIGYFRRGLVDFASAAPFIAIGVPFGVVGGLYCNSFDAALLREAYGALMLFLCIVLLTQNDETENICEVDPNSKEPLREIVSDDGVAYMYKAPQTDFFGAVLTSFGALLTGILSVGIGEVVLPQLTRRWCIPVPVAAGTSVFVVITVALSSVFGQLSVFVAMDELEKSIPVNLLCYTIPGVVLGGQLGPRIQGRVPPALVRRGIGAVFGIIGVCFLFESAL